jgi:methylase of polypeptide subunit release factors
MIDVNTTVALVIERPLLLEWSMSNFTLSTLIGKLINDFAIADIEMAFVQIFLATKHIQRTQNHLVASLLRSTRATEKIRKQLESDSVPTLKALENAFELLIPESERKLNGAFFTPQPIVEYMVAELVNAPDCRVLDCSCGSGAFLVAGLDRLRQLTRCDVAGLFKEHIYGVDILPSNIRRAQIILSLYALLNDADAPEHSFNLVVANSLEADWHQLFPSVMTSGGFDIVIGNPPYVKFQDLDMETRACLEQKWNTISGGTFNLYFAFFELGLNVLNPQGRLGYICPNNYFTSLAGRRLREFLQERKVLSKIIDFNHLMVFDAQTYTGITFLQKTPTETFAFERVEHKTQFSQLSNLKFSILRTSSLNSSKWRLLRNSEQANIHRIESAGKPLGQLMDIRVGIATLKDQLYFVEGQRRLGAYYVKHHGGNDFNIEADITRPIVKISDFANQHALRHNQRRIIFPYRVVKGKAILMTEDELQARFPSCYTYLLAVKSELIARDKGKGNYEAWFAYGRTQGLVPRGHKILTPTFSRQPRFMLDTDAQALFCNGYGLFARRDQRRSLFDADTQLFNEGAMPTLQKILNSSVMHYYISRTSVSIEGGFPCYQKNFIERFTIPDFTPDELTFLETEFNQVKIDEFLIAKYGLELEGEVGTLTETEEERIYEG